ncbi:MAG TPA: holo-ACP synthase [Acidimicrobiales bacterium]|nr:holo-ACP synthase [Acidimicrobiales bacterium]
MIGIGLDVVELERFRRALNRTPRLRERLFRPDERAYAEQRHDPVERYAVRFAAKEAVMKALGCGLGDIAMFDIEIVRAESGAPSVHLHGGAAERAAASGVTRWLLTLTHTEHIAQAIAVAL